MLYVGSMVRMILDLQRKTCCLTSFTMEQQQHNMDGMEIRGFIRGKETIEKYHKDQEGFSSVISLVRQECYCTVYCLGETMLPLPPPVETCAHGAMAYCKTNLNTHPLFTVAACGSTAQCGVKVDWWIMSGSRSSVYGIFQHQPSLLCTSFDDSRYHVLDTSFDVHLQQQSNNFYIFRCLQALSLIVVLVVDISFDGYPATHACYRRIISAMSNRDHVFTVNNVYSVLWWSSLLTNCFQEHSAAHVSHRCIKSATSNNVTYLFGAIKVYPSLKAFVVKYRPHPLEKRLLELVIVWISMQQGHWFWLLGGIRHRGFSYDSG
ncbi:hypothetical protein O0I10_003914 [Lichtheimia ornata]|uniref:Uncharacterized protein n=1 Tax=Lichtheimia ornata TaxID=688661 RepID=A0AAD7Y0U3_9FUNG|nr:uncharacterized protein O0I10_003914 [Lichtheimia ornata]KAJ8660456.1 hypothetical protein O0I10_003914 [Lichtheimia ornata]